MFRILQLCQTEFSLTHHEKAALDIEDSKFDQLEKYVDYQYRPARTAHRGT